MTIKYDLESQKRVYSLWAPIYDRVYTKLLADGQRRTAQAAAKAGSQILEVGVGTGLVLPYYPAHSHIYAIDLSEHMLAKVHKKLRRKAMAHVKLVAVMDACRLGFKDATFDAVTLPFVITLVPDPEQALDECLRVLKPGGVIIIASKLGYSKGSALEKLLAPLAKGLGWSLAFKVSRIEKWARSKGYVQVERVDALFPAGFFKLIQLRKAAIASDIAA